MKKTLIACMAFSLTSSCIYAQDVHFTQYFSSPLTLNPALTGLTTKDYRLAANFRSQWQSVSPNPYLTGSFSYDMGIFSGHNGDRAGIGVLAMYDKAGQGALQQMNIGLSAAYHKSLDGEGSHQLSLGAQAVYVQKNLDFSKLSFNDQYLAGVAGLPTSEVPVNADLKYPDFNAGLMYSGPLSRLVTGYAGISVYHIGSPSESFLGGTSTIPVRYSGYLGSAVSIREGLELFISGLYQQQGTSREIVAGSALAFSLSGNHTGKEQPLLYLGGWYRLNDAVSPYISMVLSGLQLGISYDAGLSGFNPATNGQNAYEISIVFNGSISRYPRQPARITCPRF